MNKVSLMLCKWKVNKLDLKNLKPENIENLDFIVAIGAQTTLGPTLLSTTCLYLTILENKC